jgi:hypothetical protein
MAAVLSCTAIPVFLARMASRSVDNERGVGPSMIGISRGGLGIVEQQHSGTLEHAKSADTAGLRPWNCRFDYRVFT